MRNRRHEFRSFVFLMLAMLALFIAVPLMLGQTVEQLNGTFVETPEYPLFNARVYGATAGNLLGIDSDGHVVGVTGGGSSGSETRILQSTSIKNDTIGPGAVVTLLNQTGVGNVAEFDIDLIAGDLASCRDGLLTFVVDGNTFSVPLGLYTANYGTEDYPGGRAPTTFAQTFSVSNGNRLNSPVGCGMRRREFIPYYSAITITYQNASASGNADVYSNIGFYPGAVPAGLAGPLRKYWHLYYVPFLGNYLAYGQSMNLLPTVSGPGQIEAMVLAVNGGPVGDCAIADNTAPQWLESTPALTLDGNSYTANGAEDFFGGSFYFSGGSPSLDEFGATRVGCGWNNNYFYTTMYRSFGMYPAIFNTAAQMTWAAGCCATFFTYPVNAGGMVEYWTEYPATTPTPPTASLVSAQSATLYASYTQASLISGGNTAGSALVAWPDATGNGHTINTNVGSPLYQNHRGVIPQVVFGGSADAVTVPLSMSTSAVGRTVWMVFSLNTLPSALGHTATLFSGTSDGVQGVIPMNNLIGLYAGGGPVTAPSSTLANGTIYIVKYTLNPPFSSICINGNGSVPVEPGYGGDVLSNGTLRIGYDGGTNFAAMSLYAMDIYTGIQTPAQAATELASYASIFPATVGSTGCPN